MHLDSNLRIEVLSSLLGQNLRPYDKKSSKRRADILSVDDFHLNTITGKRKGYAKERFIDEEDFFDPQFDCDFSDFSYSAECTRGDELYERPKGWYRMALKVRGKYPDGDTWLGTNGWRSRSVPGEWPVSYHGTSLAGIKGIIWSHYKAGDRTLYGRGIYSTPDIRIAEKEDYAKTFTSKTTGKSYKVILQNRINPEKREICKRSDYWLIPVRKQASAKEEKQTVESSIRPYGILIKEIKTDDDNDDTGHEDRDDDTVDDDSGDDASHWDSDDGTIDEDRSDDGTVEDDSDDDTGHEDTDDDTIDEDRNGDSSADDSCDDDTVEDRDEDDQSDDDSGDVDTGDEDRSDDYSGEDDDSNADDRDDDGYVHGDDYSSDNNRDDDDDDDDDDGNSYDDSSDFY